MFSKLVKRGRRLSSCVYCVEEFHFDCYSNASNSMWLYNRLRSRTIVKKETLTAIINLNTVSIGVSTAAISFEQDSTRACRAGDPTKLSIVGRVSRTLSSVSRRPEMSAILKSNTGGHGFSS